MRNNCHRGKGRSPSNSLQSLGARCLFLGLFLLIVPMLLGSHPMVAAFRNGVATPGWVLVGIGVVMVAIARITRLLEGTLAPGTEPRVHQESSAEQSTKRPDRWGPAVFNAIEWRRFEAVCSVLFVQAGFETRSQSHGPDGGVDIWLHSKNATGPVSVVQCKHWRGKPVGVKEMREFFGVMASQGLKRGTYATSSTFTAEATAFAKNNGIHLLDGAGLLALIAQRSPDQQQALLAVAFEGDYARPTCASCGIKMVERSPKKGGSPFWGCANFPRCRSVLPMRA